MSAARVVGLWRYPVKGMAAEALEAADVGWHGLAGDRRWAFVRPGLERSNFPWLTIRERSDLGRFVASFAEADRPEVSVTRVRTPEGDEHDVTDPALAAGLGAGVRVIRVNRGTFDAAPLTVISRATIAALEERVGSALDPRRFRPNLLVDGVDAFAEEAWVGATLTVGEAAMRVDRRDQRCVVTTVDPVTSERDPAVLRTIAQERDACLGVYGTTVTPGRVRVGDTVTIA